MDGGSLRGIFRRLGTRVRALLRRAPPATTTTAQPPPRRGPVDHVILLDGTMGSLQPARITSIGLMFRMMRAANPRASLYYGKGLQWSRWRHLREVILGWGVEIQIRAAYGWLASRYRPGDRVFLLGYSRGAFAARSLAGLIERVGLLREAEAMERNVRLAWRYYEAPALLPGARRFRERFCHPDVPIEMVGVFDTVRGLGLRLPLVWLFQDERRVLFHNHQLGTAVRAGFHALALDETRSVFAPLLWDSAECDGGRIEQVWFSGTHGDVGGQLGRHEAARPLANLPLVWMLERLERRAVALPADWRGYLPTDPIAPSSGTWQGWSKLFWLRGPRRVGRDRSERIHESALLRPRRWRMLLSRRFAGALGGLAVVRGRGAPGPVPELRGALHPAQNPFREEGAAAGGPGGGGEAVADLGG